MAIEGKRFRLLRFPRAPHRPIPMESLPGGEYAQRYIEITGAAHASEIRRIGRKLVTVIFCAIVLLLIAAGAAWHLVGKLNAPDHVIKTHEAQQRIVFGQHYEGLKTRHPEQPVITPNTMQKKQESPQLEF